MKKNINVLLIVFLLIIVIVEGFIIYEGYNNKEINVDCINNSNINNNSNNIDSNDENNTNNQIILKDSIIYLKEISDLIVMLKPFDNPWYTIDGYYDDLYGILYKKDKTLIKDLPADVKTHFVLENMNIHDVQFDKDSDYYYIDNFDFKEKYHELMGENIKYDISGYDRCSPVSIKNNQIRFRHAIAGCGDSYGGTPIYKKIVNVEKNGNDIYLYEKVAITSDLKTNEKDEWVVNVYSDVNHNNIIQSEMKEDDIENEIFSSNYINKLPMYKYTFKLENDSYIFYSVEKVK